METQTEQEKKANKICKCGHNELYHDLGYCEGMLCNCKKFELKEVLI